MTHFTKYKGKSMRDPCMLWVHNEALTGWAYTKAMTPSSFTLLAIALTAAEAMVPAGDLDVKYGEGKQLGSPL